MVYEGWLGSVRCTIFGAESHARFDQPRANLEPNRAARDRLPSLAGIRSVRTGSRPWTDTDTEVDRPRTELRFLTSVRSFKAVRTDVIGTEEQSEPTDVESVFLHVRTEPIGKIVAFTEPNRY